MVLERRTQKVKPPQMYQVVMLNDDYTPMEFVVVVIQEFFSKDLEAATQIMLKIHLDGKGVCGVYQGRGGHQGGPGAGGSAQGGASLAVPERARGVEKQRSQVSREKLLFFGAGTVGQSGESD